MINLQSLEEKLEKLPSEIYTAEKKAIEAKEKLELAKIEHQCAFADKLIVADKPNATEKKATAELLTKEEKTNVIKAQIYYEQRLAYLTSLNNQFNALRKVGSIEMELAKVGVRGN